MVHVILSLFCRIFRKCLFISVKMYKIYFVCNDFCVAFYNDKTCSVPNCNFQTILLQNIEELLKKLDTLCFTYQHVDCLYTLFKYRLSEKNILKRRKLFDNVQRAVDFNHRNKGEDRMPSIAKKRLLRKKCTKSIYSAPSKRQKQRRQVVQCLQKELKKSKRLKLIWI